MEKLENKNKVILEDDNYCFACGKDNPIGLHLDFQHNDNETLCFFVPQRAHQGYRGILHGGITATILDEIMARHLIEKGYNVVTAKMELRFRKPVKSGDKIVAIAKIDSIARKLITASATLGTADTKDMATAKGLYQIVQ